VRNRKKAVPEINMGLIISNMLDFPE